MVGAGEFGFVVSHDFVLADGINLRANDSSNIQVPFRDAYRLPEAGMFVSSTMLSAIPSESR